MKFGTISEVVSVWHLTLMKSVPEALSHAVGCKVVLVINGSSITQ